ncbi:DEAD/DEAH box helicase [Actinomarinicola tropica]|uniref:DEAD/DEAH box helicase n=1 Tax=Actinomarinicola tropica TaxID=2789776 RepID=A0A5Q2RPZ6_9ACTN|nr:DEAD/DEAH box helicase [Actinomarinicola tropica]QGG96516.1 DEAD/DEAH box helicase [Actinomarinicola tropica]
MTLTTSGSLESLLTELADDGRLVHVERIPARPARHAPLAQPLRGPAADLVPSGGLWSHQAEAIDHLRAGRSVAVATGTASGKSLCYQLPIVEAITTGPAPATALAMFPTKALAQDQLRALTDLGAPGVVAVTYDGDTSPEARAWARTHANVVLTNPDMLHAGILPHHGRWATFLRRLRFVVIDELHVLRGVFGTHVAHLLRRLRRLCELYGSSPTFVFCSATIGEPGRLAGTLCGLDVAEVLDDGSPRGERTVALLDPPVLDVVTGVRSSGHAEAASVMADLVRRGHRSLAFSRSRTGTELLAADVKARLDADLADAVRPYRGGYLATERREIEAALFSGELRGVVATTALELGVDIGGLDACVLDGYPGTIASLWQQVGRAGRDQQSSVAVLVAGDDQLDRWFMTHPRELFVRPPEPAVVNPSNPEILAPHLACAAYEKPLVRTDGRFWGELLDDGVRDLVLRDRLRIRHDRHGDPRAVWAGRGWPSHGVGLRSGSAREVRIATPDGRLVGLVDEARAHSLVHPGAIYLHQGKVWRVDRLDLDDLAAIVVPDPGDTYTQARTDVAVEILRTDARRQVGAAELSLGRVRIRSQVVGYQRKDVRTRDVIETVELDLPPTTLDTRGFWYTLAPSILAEAGVAPGAVPGTLHAAEHAAISLLPLFTICDRWDVGGVSTALQADTGLPTVVIHDGYPGGTGIAELGYEAADRHLPATLELLDACGCADGCPSCVQSPKCGNGNEPLDKHGAIALLRRVLDS